MESTRLSENPELHADIAQLIAKIVLTLSDDELSKVVGYVLLITS